jgi:hypothetical protein
MRSAAIARTPERSEGSGINVILASVALLSLSACTSSSPTSGTVAPPPTDPSQAVQQAAAPKADAPLPGIVQKGADGSLRVPFGGGSFATWNTEMPAELIDAVGGKTPKRSVVVWAGIEPHSGAAPHGTQDEAPALGKVWAGSF